MIGLVVVLAVALALNTVATRNQSKSAGVTVEGGEILRLQGGQIQVLDQGPEAQGRASRGGAEPRTFVLIHGFAASLAWWDRLAPILAREHRVIRIDLLGHGGSSKPTSGYEIEGQADLVAEALNRLNVEAAVIVGHSMGAAVAVSLAERFSQLADRVVHIDLATGNDRSELPFLAELTYAPVIGESLWRVSPDFAVRDSYEPAFAPGFELEAGFDDPDQVVEDQGAMTYSAYEGAHEGLEDFRDEAPLDARMRTAAVPLLAIFGEEEQIIDDPQAAAEEFSDVPGARTTILPGAGHSPNVELPRQTARLILEFALDGGDEAGLPRRVGLKRKRR